MKINSLDELKKIKNEHQNIIDLRRAWDHHDHNKQESAHNEKKIEILIGMATCGISSGAKETFETFREELDRQGINNAKVVPVGCIGSCHAEPTVQVNIQGQKSVIYGNVKKQKVPEIIEKHIKEGNPIGELIQQVNFVRM